MNPKEFEAVIKLPGKIRYEYFIKKVADYEELWGLYNDGWAMIADDNNNEMIPFWPKKEFAEYCATDDWKGYKAERIDLYKFMNNMLQDMKIDNVKASIFFNNQTSVVLEIDDLINDLNEELENY